MPRHSLNTPQIRVPYALAVFGKDELNAVSQVMSTPMIVPGPKVREFQQQIAALFAKKYAVMTNSGSSANLIAMELLNLPARSEVITPVLTFGTTLSPLYQKRFVPVFVDVEPGTYQIDLTQVEAMIGPKTRALMIPSLIGNIPDYPSLRKLADQYKLWLIEDSCDTLGATINGQSTGTFSDISTTSFYASHIITTAGHGGMVCFNRSEWQEKALTLIGWGRSSAKNETESIDTRFNIQVDGIPYDAKFVFEELGYNFQSTDIDAAFGLVQLQKLTTNTNLRKRHFNDLLSFFKAYEHIFILPLVHPGVDTPWLAFPLVIRDSAPFSRRHLTTYLEQNNIQTRPLFTGNASRQPAFAHLKSRKSPRGFPVADMIMRGSFVIGCHQGLTSIQIDYLKEKFTDYLAPYR